MGNSQSGSGKPTIDLGNAQEYRASMKELNMQLQGEERKAAEEREVRIIEE
jgi:hypothetical protein